MFLVYGLVLEEGHVMCSCSHRGHLVLIPFLSPLRLTVLPLSSLSTALAELVTTPFLSSLPMLQDLAFVFLIQVVMSPRQGFLPAQWLVVFHLGEFCKL